MYAKLKQMMRAQGYTVSEGDDWAASDSAEFHVFSRLVLGVPARSPNHILAYPEAYPAVIAQINAFDGIDPPAAAPVAEPAAAPALLVPESEPEAAPIDPPQTMDLSGSAPEAPQVLEVPEQPAQETEQPAEESTDAPAEESEQPAEETEQPAGESEEHSEE